MCESLGSLNSWYRRLLYSSVGYYTVGYYPSGSLNSWYSRLLYSQMLHALFRSLSPFFPGFLWIDFFPVLTVVLKSSLITWDIVPEYRHIFSAAQNAWRCGPDNSPCNSDKSCHLPYATAGKHQSQGLNPGNLVPLSTCFWSVAYDASVLPTKGRWSVLQISAWRWSDCFILSWITGPLS